VILFADHGDIVSALPFVVPMLIIGGGILFLMARERVARRRARGPGDRGT
jgi:hypothetical protein